MDEVEICEIDNVAGGEDGVSMNGGEFSRLEFRNNVNSLRVFYVLKCCLLKFAMDGADKVFKDQKSMKNSLGEYARNSIASSRTHQVGENYKFEDKRNEVDHILQEKERIFTKLNNNVLESSKDRFYGANARYNDYVDVSEMVNSPSGGYIEFPLNVLAFFAVLLIKFVGFQVNLLVSFFTFPIWLSYFSFMFLFFPFQTLRHVRRYLLRKLMRMLGLSSNTVTVKAKKTMGSVAMRFGCAFFWSIYVCFMLLGLLVSGLIFGGILMKYLVEKPFHATETLNFDYTKNSPAAFVPIMPYPGPGDSSSLIVKDYVEAGKDASLRAIPYNHKLQLTVSLTVPVSDYNRKLGVFQVRVEFLSTNGKVTATSSYPCMLRFKSQSIQVVETIIKSAPLIAGFQSESQILNIKMNEFTEGLEPTACLKVILEQRAEYKAGAGIPEIYAASLAVESELPQLKRIIWCWRRTFFVWTSIMLFLTELVIVLVFCRALVIPRGRPSIVYAKKGSTSKFTSSW